MKARKKKEEPENEMEIEEQIADLEDEQVNHPITELIVNKIFIL